MCVIFLAWQCDPDWPLVLLSNRDEFHARASKAAHWWPKAGEKGRVLAGLDLVANGSWLGVSESGRIAAVTNVRQAQLEKQAEKGAPAPRSRGDLVKQYLLSEQTASAYAADVAASARQYNPFNLLYGNARQLYWQSNEHQQAKAQSLSPGIYGLSNGLLDANWPKVQRGKVMLAELLEAPFDLAAAYNCLADTHRPNDIELPDTGVGIEMERFLAPICIRSTGYGTRFSTVVRFSSAGLIEFHERQFAADGEVLSDQHNEFYRANMA